MLKNLGARSSVSLFRRNWSSRCL